MIRPPIDITLTRTGDDLYTATSQSSFGAEFLRTYAPGDQTLPATEARILQDKAEACALTVFLQ